MAGADHAQYAPTATGLLVPERGPSFKAAARKEDGTKKLAAVLEDEPEREAWFYRDRMPEVGTMVRGSGNLISQVHLYVGYIDSTGMEMPARGIDGRAVAGFADELVAAAESGLARYSDLSGSKREILFAQSECWDVAGGGYLVGWATDAEGNPVEPDTPESVGEEFRFVANGALHKSSTVDGDGAPRYELEETAKSKLMLPVKHVRRRMYFPDTRYSGQGRGWVMGALDACRDLYFYTLAQRVAAKSGIPADLWLVPLEASPKNLTAQGWGPGADGGLETLEGPEGTWASQIEALMGQFVMEALEDARSGHTVVPAFLAVAGEFIEKFKKLSFRRDIDSELAKLVQDGRTRIAESADAPVELMRGLAGTNRWNGVQIRDDEYRRYFRPKASAIADAWTTAVLWPELAALGFPATEYRRLRVLVNPRNVVTEPDQTKLAEMSVRVGAVGLIGYRKMTGIPEQYAPTPAELEQMKELGILGSGQNERTGRGRGDQGPPSGTPDAPDDTKGALETTGREAPALTAAAAIPLADRLLSIEREARHRLEEACEATLDRAIERANAKLRNWAKQLETGLPMKLTSCDVTEVHTLLGPSKVSVILEARLPDQEERLEDLFAAAMVTLLVKYERIANAAYDQAERALGRKVPAADRRANIERGKATLRTAMLVLAEAELLGLHEWDEEGEHVEGIRVPMSLLRLVLAVAGGALIAASLRPSLDYAGGRDTAVDGTPVLGGIVFGPALSALAPPASARRWVYGTEYRSRPFPAHEDLDGAIVSGPDDPKLSGSVFTSVSTQWFPGDHGGCRCDWVPVHDEEVPR